MLEGEDEGRRHAWGPVTVPFGNSLGKQKGKGSPLSMRTWPCIKDVAIPNSASSSNDPLSPRVGCMGQVKRNNRVMGFPASHRFTATATATAAAKNANSVKYSKLKKFFSSKNLVATPGGSISGSRRELIVGGRRGSSKIDCHEDENYATVINVVDLDPPLPVIKRVQQRGDGGDSESLWKRRSGGVALKTLQLQPLHLPPHSLQPNSV
ncbi:hypothetical protein CK203_012622 [Vitis vinifera]|uniref:Uncharacterized protein n=1 Tax=Vitis vinifera TaxID=29760 RepID=A0A438KMI5_VITVI|nr:hypothetical protein CK203_012622 [Vitis vinifera]